MICKCCGIDKDLDLFAKDKSRPSGYHPYCKQCKKENEEKKRRSQGILSREEIKEIVRKRTTKVCSRCKQEKPIEEFWKHVKNSDGHRYVCINCEALEYQENREERLERCKKSYEKHKISKRLRDKLVRHARKEKVLQMFGSKCIRCGLEVSEEWPPACFDFHHLDPSKKEINIASALNRSKRMLEELMEELRGCVVMCANCHRKEHYKINELEGDI